MIWQAIHWLLGWSRIPPALQQQIDSVLDDLPDSMDDGGLIIHRLATWRLSLISASLCAAFGWALSQRAGTQNLAWIVGGAVFGVIFARAMLRASPLMLTLDANGACFVYRQFTINCPWSLFATHGEPDHHGLSLLLPTNAKPIDDVVMTRHGKIIGFGKDVRLHSFTFLGDSQLRFTNTLQLASPVLGMLLQEFAFALTSDQSCAADTETDGAETRSSGDAVAFAAAQRPADSNIGVVATGHLITIPVTRLQFPPECCNCGQPTSGQARIKAPGPYMFFIVRSFWSLVFNISCCAKCRYLEIMRAWVGGILALGAVLASATAIAYAIVGPPAKNWSHFLIIAGVIALPTMLRAIDFGRRGLLRTKATYIQESESVQFSFRLRGYVERICKFQGTTASRK